MVWPFLVDRQLKQRTMIWLTTVAMRESFVAARNVCIDVIQGIFSPGGDVDALVKFWWNSSQVCLIENTS